MGRSTTNPNETQIVISRATYKFKGLLSMFNATVTP